MFVFCFTLMRTRFCIIKPIRKHRRTNLAQFLRNFWNSLDTFDKSRLGWFFSLDMPYLLFPKMCHPCTKKERKNCSNLYVSTLFPKFKLVRFFFCATQQENLNFLLYQMEKLANLILPADELALYVIYIFSPLSV